MDIDVSNVKVGDKFSTENKLIRELGLEPKKGRNRKFQINDINRYLSYEKTGKIIRNKETNEITIIDIFDKPIEKKRKQQEGIYKTLLIESFRIIQSGQYTRSELMKHCGLVEDCSVVSTYVTEEMANMTAEEVKGHRDKSNYINKFKKSFDGHAKTAFNNLKKEGFDYSYTYLIKDNKDDTRNDFRLATKKEDSIIRETEEKYKKEIEKKYNKSFDSIKFTPKRYKEYIKNVDKELLSILGIWGHYACYDIFQSKSILDKYNTPDNSIHIMIEVKPALKELYRIMMKEYVESYKYEWKPDKSEIKSAGFGRRECKIVNEPIIYTLRDSMAVKLLHEKIFGIKDI